MTRSILTRAGLAAAAATLALAPAQALARPAADSVAIGGRAPIDRGTHRTVLGTAARAQPTIAPATDRFNWGDAALGAGGTLLLTAACAGTAVAIARPARARGHLAS